MNPGTHAVSVEGIKAVIHLLLHDLKTSKEVGFSNQVSDPRTDYFIQVEVEEQDDICILITLGKGGDVLFKAEMIPTTNDFKFHQRPIHFTDHNGTFIGETFCADLIELALYAKARYVLVT